MENSIDRIASLENALARMWQFASALVEAHGMNGDDSMTDAHHRVWQEVSGTANALLSGRAVPAACEQCGSAKVTSQGDESTACDDCGHLQ